ncbi:hypothetical protein QWY77_11835 [Thalassotalea ponticola]|nr:hypothetical protein [Thalassotalea ponticola]MDN3653433.1 hypothetical protein [Thalassotalea ponticola]
MFSILGAYKTKGDLFFQAKGGVVFETVEIHTHSEEEFGGVIELGGGYEL